MHLQRESINIYKLYMKQLSLCWYEKYLCFSTAVNAKITLELYYKAHRYSADSVIM